MYKGTLRYNLDPTGKMAPSSILNILRKAQLHNLILKKDENYEALTAQQQEDLDQQLLDFDINDNLSSG